MSSLPPSELEAVAAPEVSSLTAGSSSSGIVGRSLWQIAWRRLRRDKLALTGGVVVIVFALIAILAPILTKIYGQDYHTQHNYPPDNLLDPGTQMPLGHLGGVTGSHWLGVTPVTGQDILSLLMFGARTSLIIGLAATALSVILGVAFGTLSGYFRGWVDGVVSRFMDVILSFPTLLLSLSLIAVVALIRPGNGPRYLVIIFVLGFFGFPYIGRIVRGQVLSLREKEFVDAARSLGASNLRIMAKEIAPNLVGPILVYTTLTIPNNILGEAGLSFLGIGIQPPTPTWGQMLADAGSYFQIDPMYLVFPGLAIFITVMAFNLFGDGLRDALDPKSSR
jgi:peptide/nickel transport system permease protein